MPTKKTKLLIIMLGSGILLLLVFLFLNNKVRYFKKVANTTFDTIENINQVTSSIPILNGNFHDLNVKIKDENVNEEALNFHLNLDYAHKYLKLEGSLLNKDNTILDTNFIYNDNKTYFNLGNILPGNYEFNYNLNECDDPTEESSCLDEKYYLNDLLENIFNSKRVDNTNINNVLKKLRKIVVNSFDKRYIDKRKISINKETYTRYSYVLNSYSLQKLVTKIDSDKTLKDAIFNIFSPILNDLEITKDNFKEILLSSENNIGTITLNVSKNKVTKVVLNIIDTIEITVNINEKNKVIEFKNASANGTITLNKENNNIKLKLFDANSNAIDLDITLKNASQTIKYGIYGAQSKSLGVLTNEISTNNNDDIAGVLNIKNSNMNLNIDYQFKNQDNIITNITDAKKFTDLTEVEVDNALDTLENTLDTKLINKIIQTIKDLLGVITDSDNDTASDFEDITLND